MTSPQRAYRAACPNCGAPVEFASAASASAVCSYCRSTLVRDGEALRRIGVSAELFDDHSPLQLGATGTRQGVAFTLVGRLQYSYDGGTWNEWHALFDNGRSAWLSEDNGAYVLAFDGALPPDAPPLDERLQAGQRVLADGRAWDVASVVRARLLAAQGELPAPPRLEGEFLVADLRNAAGEVATLDGSDARAVHWSLGRSVLLAELRMQGLADPDARAKTLGARGLACPSCGAALEPKLATTQSLACGQCKAVVDISAGVGAELAFHAQNNSGASGFEPQIPLGKTGILALGTAPAPWQVVGFLERCDLPDDPGEDTTFWREYLLYHATHGFAFLVDSEDGWSWVRPITGAPQVRGDNATWLGAGYRRTYSYRAKVTWVLGEFYWRVQRDEEAFVSDYVGTGADSAKRLSREETRGTRPGAGSEVVWSAGAVLEAAAVAQAFGLDSVVRSALDRQPSPDIKPVSDFVGSAVRMVALIIFILVLVSILSQCGDDDCDELRGTFGANSNEYRQCVAQRGSGTTGRVGGGSYGGWSSGGGHK